MALDSALSRLLDDAVRQPGPVVVLTGAGISAESGIPTFRGAEGYWTVGSRNYRPEELSTFEAFARMPAEVWSWYLYRRSVCREAAPNPAHRALVELESALGDDFVLITQNPAQHAVVWLMSILREGQEMFIDPLFPYANSPASPMADFSMHVVIVAAETWVGGRVAIALVGAG